MWPRKDCRGITQRCLKAKKKAFEPCTHFKSKLHVQSVCLVFWSDALMHQKQSDVMGDCFSIFMCSSCKSLPFHCIVTLPPSGKVLSTSFKLLSSVYAFTQLLQTTHTFIDLTFLLAVGSGPIGFDPAAWQKADWFFSPSLHYIHCPLQYSRRESRQAAAELELITHLFNRLAETMTEKQRMPESRPCALFKWFILIEWRITTEYECTGGSRNLEKTHFGHLTETN